MSIHDKLIDRLYDYLQICWECGNGALEDAAQAINEGRFDDLLGVREPTLDDVKREAARVFGKHTAVRAWEDGLSIQVGTVVLNEPLYAPTITAVYAALRAMKDYEGEE